MELLRRSSFIISRQISRQFSDTMPQGFSEDGQEKGKKKKWWGELFKRRNRKVSDSSSEEDEEDGKRRGFLRRKKHDRGSKDVTNSFVINPGIKQDRGRSLESVRSSGDQTIDRTSERSNTSKRRLKAKVEASREQLKDSSSDEGSSYTSSLPSGGSFPRRSRIARTERHNRRQLWSASVVYQESNDYDTKFRAKARSATPSPAASPKIKPRAASQDSVAPPPPPRRMEIPKYQPPVYTAPSIPRYNPRYNGLPHHSSDPVIPKDWNEVDTEKMPADEKKPPAPPRRQPSQEERKRQAHLEEALNELEAIYKKLEDLQDTSTDKNEEPRAEDDMAYRKLNKRETSSQDIREILSQGSYLLVSPTLSPPSIVPSSPNGIEPDVTYDDVVYRTVNHSNNSLKCLDPQPLFGIPVGPISPAPSSDYLHAKPNQFELKQPDEPDVVTDDLAFRNLRKDNQELRKKKAVRSLSANLSNVIFRNNNNISSINNNNLDNKSQSYSDIPEEMRLAQRVLDMRRAKKNEVKHNRPQLPRANKEEMRRKFFADVYDNASETDLLKELEDEARATSLEIEQQLSKQKPDALYSRSMTDLLEELTKNLDYDFGQATNSASCQTCGDSDTSKISRGSSSFHSHASPPMKAKTVARAASHHDKPDSPKARNKLQSVQNASSQVPPNIKDRPRFPLPHEQKENMQQEEKKSFTPYRSSNNSIGILRDSCENLPKIRKKVESPRLWENVKPEEQHPRTASPRNPSPRSSNALDELFTNLSQYKPEGPKFNQKPARAEQRSASLKIQSETPRPWEAGNFKGRSDSYHGPMQMRSGTPQQLEGSPNSRRRLTNSSPKRIECSPNNSFRRRTPSPNRHHFRNESPSQWEKSLDELCKFQEPFFHPVQQVQHMQHKRESPRPWLSRQSPIERDGTLIESYRLSPQPSKSISPKPWTGYLNSSEGQPMHRDQPHYPLSIRKDMREGSRSPKHWPMPLSVGRSLDEGSYLASERLSAKPRWSSVRERVLNEQYNPNSEIIQPMNQQAYKKESPKNWPPAHPPNELCQMHDYLQRASPKRLSQETLQVPELHMHRPTVHPEIHIQHNYNRESPKRMMELAIHRVPDEMYNPQNYHRESPKQLLVEHPLQRNLSNEILNYGYQRESPSQMYYELRRHSNDEGYRRVSPRQMVSEHGQRVVNSQLLNQVSYKRDSPSPRWGSMEEKHSPPLKIKHPAPWRHSIASSDRVEVGRQSPQSMRQSPVRIQRSPVRDEPNRLTKCENTRTWEDLNTFYNKLSEKKKASPSWESLDVSKEMKSSPELKINELTVGYTESDRPKTPESPRRLGTSPKDLSPSMQRKELGNQLDVIGENRIARRESQSRIESPIRLYRSSSSREDESYRRSPPTRDSFVDRVFPPEDSRHPPLFNSSPIDVAAMEAESEEEKDQRSGQEEYVGRCDRGGMVGPTQNMSTAAKDERIARYKEERRRQLAAQFGPRDNHQPLGAIRSTRASRLRTQANSESIKGSKDLTSKDVDSPTYFPKSRLIKPSSPQLPDVATESYQKKCTMVSPNLGGVCSPRGAKKPSTTSTPPSSSPIPRSAQLVKRASMHEREMPPAAAITTNHSPREPTNGISSISSSISSTTISSGNVTPLRVSSLLVPSRQSPPTSPSPTRHPSILKKSSLEEVQASSTLTAPVSILKRKTTGEAASSSRCHSPLRFSPNTVDKKGRGILKKHRSLDETQVINSSLEVSNGVNDSDEPRPILKSQPRRCSLEEVVKRTDSPEPQGILKRKASREETEVPTETILHPHGILKKKSSVTEEPVYESLDCPRPILKKKSSSEEDEYIKPILKVSSRKSLEGDDGDQKKEDGIKPILKHPDEVVLRQKKTDPEKRVTSLDLSLFCRPSSGGEGRPLSVAERVNGLEILLNIKKDELSVRMEEGDGNTTLVRRGSVNERASLFNQIEEKEKADAEAAKTRRTLRGPRNRSRAEEGTRFRTQPVTYDEVEQAKRNNELDCEDPSNLTLAQRVKLFSSITSTEKLHSGGTTPVAVNTPQPAPRKLLPSPVLSGVLVEGLLKNLASKDGAPVKIHISQTDRSLEDSSSTESSDSEAEGEISDGARHRILSPRTETVGGRRRDESSSEDASSGGREVQDILRRQMTIKKSNSSAEEMLGEVTALRRCATQPIPRDEVDDLPKTTIAERLAALRKNGNTNWMKRIEKPIEEIISAKPPSGGSSRVTERLGQLETASQGWKTRVGPQDAQQFTVAGKMSSESPALPPVPVLGAASRKPTPIVFSNKGIASASVPSVPDSLAELMKRSISVPEGDEDETSTPSTVKVPQPDEDFAAFFPETDLSRLTSDGDVDLDAITIQSHDLLVQRRTVRVQRKYKSVNPIKALQNRTDIKTEYIEVKSGVAEREIRRMNIEKLPKNCGLAVEALAALASKEDITGVALKKAGEGSPATRQWMHPLLLRIKGRRHPLTSIIRPHYTSINQGDSFVLVTQNQVFHWIGEFCNVIEKSRGADIAQHIETEKDLGCTGATNVISLDGSSFSEKHRQFWKLLSLPDDMMSTYNGENAGHPGEDEVYEKAVSETYMAYELDDDQLLPVSEFWGRCPKIEILNSSKVLVFDFTTEVYMWAGKNAGMSQRRKGTELAQKLYRNVCEAHATWKATGIPWLDREMTSKNRPEHSVFARTTQHMEPIVFKEKFLDWPDFTKVIRSSSSRNIPSSRKVDGSVDARPCDAQAMLAWSLPPPDLILDGTHLGRGRTYYDSDRMLHYDVSTQELLVWTVHGSSKVPLPPSSVGHFLDTESYVIRWKYNVKANARELSGLPSKHTDVGRDRLAYFVWHGSHAPVVEQGTAALLTACPEDPDDAEHGPILTLQQGGDSPAFAAMFPGPIVFHNSEFAGSSRLFLVTGEEEGEVRFEEVEAAASSLRSRASLLLLDTLTADCYLWHGAKCPTSNQYVASAAVDYLTKSPAKELRVIDLVNISVTETHEGEEPEEFFGGRGLIDRQIYGSLLDADVNIDWTPRLFHLSSIYGEFTASPVIPMRFNPDCVTPYPYSKDDLYSTSQPSLMLLDLDNSLFLWTGWMEGDLDSRGSVWGRHGAERIASLTTSLHYWDLRGKLPRDVHVVCAGIEPPQFKAAFAVWGSTPKDEIAREFNLNDGHTEDEMKSVQDELRGITKTYPISELTALPLPAGVDPTRLEEYLTDQDFKSLIDVSKEEFKKMPSWKQTNLKKNAGLF